MTQDIVRLRRIGWAVRGVFALGIAASLAGNVLHAADNVISQAISAWSPVALLLAVELISRIPALRGALTAVRLGATAVIAGIAAWVSYWHMVSVAARNGESASSAHLLPLSVDGLVVVASVSLVEIAARLRVISTPSAVALVEPPAPVTVTEPDPAVTDQAEPSKSPGPEYPTVRPSRRPSRPAPRSAADKVTRLRAKNPTWTVGQIAEKAGVTERTARRHLNTPTSPPVAVTDGVTAPETSTSDIAA
jgi:hypothetical protein